MCKKNILKMMRHFSDQMVNLILEVEQDEDNIEYETTLRYLLDLEEDYHTYLEFYKTLYKEIKKPSKRRQRELHYFELKENYFIERIQKEVDLDYEQFNEHRDIL